MGTHDLEKCRYFLKDTIRLEVDFSQTDQSRGVPPPPIQKPVPDDAETIDLVRPGRWDTVGAVDLEKAIRQRRSHRTVRNEPLTLQELSWLLWATQGVRDQSDRAHVFRTVPSAGCRHALETYLGALNVEGLDVGFYRYLPLGHQLVLEYCDEAAADRIVEATLGQDFAGKAAAVFIWTTIAYRMEWRYGPAAHKVIALDAGHVCQNLYLACAAVGAGTCAVGAYHQEKADRLVRVDGREEFVIYLAAVGKV